MPIAVPALDPRRYQDLLDEALARIPVHTPEWTNFNPSDPGVTLIEVFAFLTESLLYRANQIPERNHAKFLQLLGVPMRPAASARGLVAFANESGRFEARTLDAGLEALAGDVPFRTDKGLDVLPVEARVFYKRRYDDADGSVGRHYRLLYASLREEDVDSELALYRTMEFPGGEGRALDLGADTVDGSAWIALLARPLEVQAHKDRAELHAAVRKALGGKTLSLGIVPALAAAPAAPDLAGAMRAGDRLEFELPQPAGAVQPGAKREAKYRSLDARASVDVLLEPGVVELVLPPEGELVGFEGLDPLEVGSGKFPPALDDAALEHRVVTWLRVTQRSGSARFQWLGINVAPITQRNHIAGEVLEAGSGEPDQVRRLANPPVIRESVRIYVAEGERWVEWKRIDDLFCAGAEVVVPDPRLPPGAPPPPRRESLVFQVDAESGEVRFGDGLRGRRPPAGARMRASYDHSKGPAGNVAAGAVNTSSHLPPGFKVGNPVRTWGGAAAESVEEAKKQVPRYLQHRDRLVNAPDFEAIALRTPGVDIARVEVLPVFSPDIAPDTPGNAPGAVTLMLVPRHDPLHPDTPEPDRLFIDAVCKHLAPRRLVTTELILRGPAYRKVWITCGIEALAGATSIAEVREGVKRRLLDFLAPLRETGLADPDYALQTAGFADMRKGWPLRKAVSARELVAVAARAPGVRLVNGVRIADGDGVERDEIPMAGLQLPRVAGIAVQVGDAPSPRELAGAVAPAQAVPGGKRLVPVPVIPEEC